MTQATDRSAPTELRPEQRIRPAPAVPPTSPFMRWLGWLLVGALLLGGAGLIWYGIVNDADTAVVEAPYAPAAVDPHESPEILRIDRPATWEAPSSPSGMLVAPAREAIDPHESPEILRITPVDPFAEPRIP